MIRDSVEELRRMNKKIIIIAGPNGAGKTTFARSFLPEDAQVLRFLNADLIAAGLSPFAPETVAIKAARLMLEEMAECVRREESFALETTLSGRSYLSQLKQWRSQGYHISLFFLALSSAETAIARVAERVRQGGHHIPEDTIRRRFTAGLKNFEHAYKTEVDAWAKFDNDGEEPILLEWREYMTPEDISKAKDPDVHAALGALKRASLLARKTAIQTDTDLVVVKNGRLTRISAKELREGSLPAEEKGV